MSVFDGINAASRFAKYYQAPDGKERRTLIKAYGIRFDVVVFGTVRPREKGHHLKCIVLLINSVIIPFCDRAGRKIRNCANHN